MGFSNSTKHKTFVGLALALLAAALYLFGTGEARAPNAEIACIPMQTVSAVPDPAADSAADADTGEPPLDAAQEALVEHLSRRFQVAGEAMRTAVMESFRAGRDVGLDPLLLLAVIAIESRFNPVAESSMGAKGLMQIIPKYHRARLMERGGEDAVLDPASNIQVGARILREYVQRTGTLEAGLQFYNGASWDRSAQYSQKVMTEHARLEAALRQLLRGPGQRRAVAESSPLKGS
jgi:soluble lytic murein transglycosylase-like protein